MCMANVDCSMLLLGYDTLKIYPKSYVVDY